MPSRFEVDNNFKIPANSTQTWRWRWTSAPNKGNVIFGAVPKGPNQQGDNSAENVLFTYDTAIRRGATGSAEATQVFYEFKIRNESSIDVPFILHIVHFKGDGTDAAGPGDGGPIS